MSAWQLTAFLPNHISLHYKEVDAPNNVTLLNSHTKMVVKYDVIQYRNPWRYADKLT